MKIETESIKRLLSEVSKETIKKRPPALKIAIYEYLRKGGVPEHKAIKKAAGVRYDKFQKLYEEVGILRKLRAKLKDIKKIPLLKQYRTLVTRIPTHTAHTYTQSGTGERLYQLVISGNYRNEKTGYVEYQTHVSRPKLHKDFNTHYEEALAYNEYKDTNWILITNSEDPDYVKIDIRWRRYGGKKGISPFKQMLIDRNK